MTDLLSLAWLSYNFNILAATGIVYFLLAIMYQRSKRIIINTAEQPYKPDNSMIKLVIKFSIVAVIWFAAQHYGLDEYIKAVFEWTSELIGGFING